MFESTWVMFSMGVGLLGLSAFMALTGRWRIMLSPFKIRADQMTVERLGLYVEGDSVPRVNAVLSSFAGGFNVALDSAKRSDWSAYCSSLPVFQQPFAHEGVAMGFIPTHLFRYDPTRFEDELVKPGPEFRYLHYVGLGFWCGMRKTSARRVEKMVEGLDPLHRYLVFDGYGFAQTFFHYRKKPQVIQRLDAFSGYARNAAYQGVGRAFYFLYLSRVDLLVKHLSNLGDMAREAAAGVGLATAFVNPDRLDQALESLDEMPDEWHGALHLGLCFGLKARSINHLEQFERDLDRLSNARQDAIRQSIRECDRVELLVRDVLRKNPDRRKSGYRVWRESVTEWMNSHIVFPLAGVNSEKNLNRKALDQSLASELSGRGRGREKERQRREL